jgi:uncharacterized protein (UPF0332 family)
MSFDWSHYLKLAKILLDNTKGTPLEEASYRAAIRRAYYAIFCSCRNYVRDNAELIPAGDAIDHSFVKDHFTKSSDVNRIKINQILGDLRKDRNSADYEDEYYGDLAIDSKKAIRQAKQILDLLKEL